MSITIKVTKRMKRAAEFSKQSVRDFCDDSIAECVKACERDYLIHEGEVIGDRCEIEALEIETLPD
jgi:hypothetical protein